MPPVSRIIAGGVGALLALEAIRDLITLSHRQFFDPLTMIFGAVAGVGALLCLGFAFYGGNVRNRKRLLAAVVTGAVLGGVGLVLGVIGALAFAPEGHRDQAPLIGFVVTAPLGFVLGAVIGFVLGGREKAS